jgi:hypothetical protein
MDKETLYAAYAEARVQAQLAYDTIVNAARKALDDALKAL